MEGWAGWAWVWLRLVRARLAVHAPRRMRALHRELSRHVDEEREEISVIRGVGAYAVVTALAATIDDSFAELLPPMFDAWRRACARSAKTDAYAGTAGVLLAAGEIEACLPGRVPRALVQVVQERTIAGVQADLRHETPRPALGFAHGYAGYLLSLELARSVFGLASPKELLRDALEMLEDSRLEAEDGAAFWPYAPGEDQIQLNAWCNGSPGIALALLGCNRIGTPRLKPRYRELALRALGATRFRMRSNLSFCCGTIGRVQVLIEASRLLGEQEWLREAKSIARTLPPSTGSKHRHFRNGTLGTIYMQWRLAHPERLPFPAFGGIER
jgi:hypothetical protein